MLDVVYVIFSHVGTRIYRLLGVALLLTNRVIINPYLLDPTDRQEEYAVADGAVRAWSKLPEEASVRLTASTEKPGPEIRAGPRLMP